MIDPKELRIGNWILLSGESYQITRKSFDEISWEETMPIGLTPEILQQCGFENKATRMFNAALHQIKIKGNDGSYIDILINLGKNEYAVFVTEGVWHDKNIFVRYVDYIHEIQNLYFALTGQELEYKTEKVKA